MPAKQKGDSSNQTEETLARHSVEVRDLIDQLRTLLRATAPTASEAAYPGWHAIGYRHRQVGYFCGIFPQSTSVNLLFEFGILLPDPQNLLQGTGKQVRFLPLHPADPLPTEAIQQFILAALDLPKDRVTKLALIDALMRK